MEAFEILIIILSVTLTVFLLAGIVFLALLIKIAKQVKAITSKAESVANNLASASQYMKPAVVSATVAKFFRSMINNRAKKGRQDDE